MSVTGGIMAGVGLAGSIGGAAIESNAAGNAASTQANAAEQNAQLEAELGQEQLGYEGLQYGNTLALDAPWLNSGANSLATLDYLMGVGSPTGAMPGVSSGTTNPGAAGIPGGAGAGRQTAPGLTTGSSTLSIPGVSGQVKVPTVTGLTGQAATNLGAFGSLMDAYPGGQFSAPTLEQAQQMPGYKFALQQGEGAMQASAAANGSLLTGGTQTALNNYAQNYADTNYNNLYNQALNTYQTNYNTWANQGATEYNRLAAMAGMGQTTAQQLGTAGLTSANQVGSTLGQTGNAIAQQGTNAAAATASGYIGGANAWGGALNNGASSLSQMLMLQQLMNGGAPATGNGPVAQGVTFS